jgi:hypothetical protein
MGGVYSSDELLDYENLYCETCGDSDIYLGKAETFSEGWKIISDSLCGVDVHGSGGFALPYVFTFLMSEFRSGQLKNYKLNEYYEIELSEDEILNELRKIFTEEGEDAEALIKINESDEYEDE